MLVALFAATVFCSVAEANEAIEVELNEQSCLPPPSGKYKGNMYLPLPDGGFSKEPATETEVHLEEKGSNLYTGGYTHLHRHSF